jgi:hypothetical protein
MVIKKEDKEELNIDLFEKSLGVLKEQTEMLGKKKIDSLAVSEKKEEPSISVDSEKEEIKIVSINKKSKVVIPHIVIPINGISKPVQRQLHEFKKSQNDFSTLPDFPAEDNFELDQLSEMYPSVKDKFMQDNSVKNQVIKNDIIKKEKKQEVAITSETVEPKHEESINQKIKESFFNFKKKISNRLAIEKPETFYKRVKESVSSPVYSIKDKKVNRPILEPKIIESSVDNLDWEQIMKKDGFISAKSPEKFTLPPVMEEPILMKESKKVNLPKAQIARKPKVPKKQYFESEDFKMAVSNLVELKNIISHDLRYLVNDLSKKKEIHEQEVVRLNDKTEQMKVRIKTLGKIIPIKNVID